MARLDQINGWRADPQLVSKLVRIERAERKAGKWGSFSMAKFPMGTVSASGWGFGVQRGLRNKWLAILLRDITCPWGTGVHVAYRTASETELTWIERQALKNQIFGPLAVGFEIMPRDDRVIDEAPMFHMWVFPEGFEVPFGIHKDDPMALFCPPVAGR